jgi:long-chain acyl-CoA synthetase
MHRSIPRRGRVRRLRRPACRLVGPARRGHLAHCYAQLIQYGAVYSRTVLGLADTADALAELPTYQPDVVLSVPRLREKAYHSAWDQAAADGHGKIFARAEATAIAYSQALDTGGPALALRLKHALFGRLVYARLRAALGGQVH